MAALSRFGRYEILSELGRGAMGVVYKARDPMLERTVAIKTIDMALEGNEAAQYEARFQQEARAAGGLNHPNIVTVHDIGKAGEVAFMAMEFIDGAELRDLLEPGKPMALARAVSIAAQVAEGLAYAHERGVVHRDVKPPNIMVTASGLAKITDFGIARMRSSQLQTQTGAVMGSPKYMSPEQVSGLRADHRSDLFSLGIILYEMVAGAPPFAGDSLASLMYQTVHVAPPAPSTRNAEVPPVLDAICAKLLAKKPDERYATAAEVAKDLRDCERGLAGATPPPPASVAATFAPGELPEAIDLEASTLAPPAHARREDEATVPVIDSPARGVARAFDSNEATMRLERLTLSAGVPTGAPQAAATGLRWGRRDLAALIGAALAGGAAAALILAS